MSEQIKSPICQSCEMPMNEPDKFGTNADGNKSDDYCCYCWKNGSFTDNRTLDEAIEANIPFVIEDGEAATEEEARTLLRKTMPTLKRWTGAR